MNCTSQRVKRAKQRIADEKYATKQKKLTPEEKSQQLRTGTQALAAAMSAITMTNGPYSKLI